MTILNLFTMIIKEEMSIQEGDDQKKGRGGTSQKRLDSRKKAKRHLWKKQRNKVMWLYYWLS